MIDFKDKTWTSATVVADSINERKERLTTMVVTFPRIILAEFNTHRVFSRNSASSRAVPFKSMKQRVSIFPFTPTNFMKDHKGMQGSDYFPDQSQLAPDSDEITHQDIGMEWRKAAQEAVGIADRLNKMGLTKQLCNRILEPFMWHCVIVSATEWENFFALRAHEAAEVHMQQLAYEMLKAYNRSNPAFTKFGEWHIPFGDKIDPNRFEEIRNKYPLTCRNYSDNELKKRIAIARCARVSYLNFEGKDDYEADLNLFIRLRQMGHWSPFEHIAMASRQSEYYGNFKGWAQCRKLMGDENKKDKRINKK